MSGCRRGGGSGWSAALPIDGGVGQGCIEGGEVTPLQGAQPMPSPDAECQPHRLFPCDPSPPKVRQGPLVNKLCFLSFYCIFF